MRLWRRKVKTSDGGQNEPVGLLTAKKAVEHSENALAVVMQRTAQVGAVVERVQELREGNHFSDRIKRMVQE